MGERITANGAFQSPSLRQPGLLMLPGSATGTEVSVLQDPRSGGVFFYRLTAGLDRAQRKMVRND